MEEDGDKQGGRHGLRGDQREREKAGRLWGGGEPAGRWGALRRPWRKDHADALSALNAASLAVSVGISSVFSGKEIRVPHTTV